MNIQDFNQERNDINRKMSDTDDFFRQFGILDENVYFGGAIPKKYKELIGLSISIFTRCEECVMFHIQNCIEEGAGKLEIVEAIKIGVIGGGSVTYPCARFAFKILENLGI